MAKKNETIWLQLGDGVEIEIDRNEAMTFTREEFADFFQRHVQNFDRRFALAWADKQIELRGKATP